MLDSEIALTFWAFVIIKVGRIAVTSLTNGVVMHVPMRFAYSAGRSVIYVMDTSEASNQSDEPMPHRGKF